MKQKEKLKLFWKITDLINKKYCHEKIVIKKIYLVSAQLWSAESDEGCYGFYNRKKKIIVIKEKETILSQIRTLVHELVHSYQYQVLDYEKKKAKCGSRKQWEKFIHNKSFDKQLQMFSKTVISRLYVTLK